MVADPNTGCDNDSWFIRIRAVTMIGNPNSVKTFGASDLKVQKLKLTKVQFNELVYSSQKFPKL